MAPQWFEVQAATFISHKGEVAARAEVDYDILITQRLVARPRIETNLSFQNVPELGIGRVFNDAELGVRVRYEIRREFAPYVGLAWSSKFGQTAAFARAEGEPVRNLGHFLTKTPHHHQQAMEMAQLCESKAANADVKRFCAKLLASQQKEKQQMDRWRQSWYQGQGSVGPSEMQEMEAKRSRSHQLRLFGK